MLKTHYLDVKIRGLPQGNWRNWSGAKPVVGPTDRMVCGSAGWSEISSELGCPNSVRSQNSVARPACGAGADL